MKALKPLKYKDLSAFLMLKKNGEYFYENN